MHMKTTLFFKKKDEPVLLSTIEYRAQSLDQTVFVHNFTDSGGSLM